MHGAKAIMAAEPPSRQDLRQMPTIIVESPLGPKTDEVQAEDTKESRNADKEAQKKKIPPSQVHVNPHPPRTEPSALLEHTTLQGSKESLSSAEHDTYL